MRGHLPEIDKSVLDICLLVLEANANFFYLNIQKYAGNKWEHMAKTSKCTSDKLQLAKHLMESYKKFDT